MKLTDQIVIDDEVWLEPLESVFREMDTAYDQVAGGYGFTCSGCEESCCYTRFYHHTLLEYLYLIRGVSQLKPETLKEVESRAAEVVEQTADAEKKGELPRIMCPVNQGGRCLIYQHRPMVCRLHGISHELRKPGQEPVRGSGCNEFSELTESMEYIPFDRTPFYIEMARLEGEIRNHSGFAHKLRHTIAEMILL